ncbi:hypothetical protein [Bacillus sp. AFS096315]|uniref:hypothetical protein n=1 Tax=Bacillus sp. AFS096315 TaxID=2033517 RepID=UPI000BEDD57D|nr:hypothetical protein [Bacillus sp. AFS096315]PEC48656.1 hypothetical protein CON00_13805 [Bacillus sp. AFS096315]
MEFRSSGRLSNFLVAILFTICMITFIFYVQRHGFPNTTKSYMILTMVCLIFLAYIGYTRSMVIRINDHGVTYEHWGFKRTIPAHHITRVNLQYRYKETPSHSAYLVINHPEESIFIPSMMFQGQIERITKEIRERMIY